MKKMIQIGGLMMALVLLSFSVKEVVVWKAEVIDAGKVEQGVPKTFEFVMTNESDKEVVITSVKASCGCTASDYTRGVIKPHENGVVKAVFNAAVKGPFTKTVTVYTSLDEAPKVLTLKGEVQ